MKTANTVCVSKALYKTSVDQVMNQILVEISTYSDNEISANWEVSNPIVVETTTSRVIDVLEEFRVIMTEVRDGHEDNNCSLKVL